MAAGVLRTAILGLAISLSSMSASAADLRVERVVLLMRHGVRPPTKAVPMPAGFAADPWPAWPVKPGYLTPHGADGVRELGRSDRETYRALLGAGACPPAGAVEVISDSDERTIRTGDAYLEGLAPACAIANGHRPQDDPDPLFSPVDEGAVRFDAARARAAVVAALPAGGLAALDAASSDVLARLDRIYGCCAPALCPEAKPNCSLASMKSALAPMAPNKRPKLVGALDLGSTAAQILLLQYAEGKPMAEVGWGRATAADITAASSLHALEFQILARPPYLAAANIAPIVRRMLAALTTPHGARLTMLAGHDTNVASLGGLLGLHWQVPGYAPDDPPPGGAIILQLLRNPGGERFVRAIFRAQSLEQLRAATPLGSNVRPYEVVMPIEGCQARRDSTCSLARFKTLINQRISEVTAS